MSDLDRVLDTLEALLIKGEKYFNAPMVNDVPDDVLGLLNDRRDQLNSAQDVHSFAPRQQYDIRDPLFRNVFPPLVATEVDKELSDDEVWDLVADYIRNRCGQGLWGQAYDLSQEVSRQKAIDWLTDIILEVLK